MQQPTRLCLLLALLVPLVAACSTEQPTSVTANSQQASATTASTSDSQRPAGWNDASHGNDVDPNYAVVFPQDKVNTMTITISPEQWKAMQENMTELYGEPNGEQGGPGGGGMGGPPADGQGEPPADGPGAPLQGGGQDGMGGGPMGIEENPMWVSSTITFNNETWTNVGIRYKGNSSLRSSWNQGTLKIPFKLDFDQFEDDYPEIKNQRFYGFKKLAFANNWGDETAMRDTITYDMLEQAGLPASETAYYEITLDYGEGATSLGLYTLVEETDDTVIPKFFGSDNGNIYKPEGNGATLADGTKDEIKEGFAKENNENEADWSDVETLYDVLHSEQRTSDPAAWRASLEKIFDVDGFLEWLAISTEIQHWDTYGGMAHNFYLYDDPKTGKLTWISWDHNLVLGAMGGMGGRGNNGGQANPQAPTAQPSTTAPNASATATAKPNPQGAAPAAPNGQDWQGRGGRGGGGFGRGGSALDKSDTTDAWPLIRYLMDDQTYYDTYVSYMRATVADGGVLDGNALTATYDKLATLLRPYAAKESSEASFDAALAALKTRTEERIKAVNDFLATK